MVVVPPGPNDQVVSGTAALGGRVPLKPLKAPYPKMFPVEPNEKLAVMDTPMDCPPVCIVPVASVGVKLVQVVQSYAWLHCEKAVAGKIIPQTAMIHRCV